MTLSSLTQKIRRNQNYQQLLSNFLSLGIVQFTNYLIPLLTFPYLLRVVGTEKFGSVSYGLSIMSYMIVVVEYGFSISATREASLHRKDTERLSKLFSVVMTTRLVLFAGCILLLMLLMLVGQRFRQDALMYSYGTLFILGFALLPTWLYQGIEQMRQISIFNFIGKLVQLGLLVLFVHSPADYLYVIGIYGLANVVSGIYAIWMAHTKFGIRLTRPALGEIKDCLFDGWRIFLINLSSAALNNINILILGLFVNDHQLGLYSAAEKVIFSLWQLLILFSQAIYPYLCRLTSESHEKLQMFVRRVGLGFSGFILLVCITIFLLADFIILIIAGHPAPEASTCLRILVFAILVVSLNIPAHQTMLAYNITRDNSTIYAIAAVGNIIICAVACRLAGIYGAAFSMVFIQATVLIAMYTVLEKKYPQYSLLHRPKSLV